MLRIACSQAISCWVNLTPFLGIRERTKCATMKRTRVTYTPQTRPDQSFNLHNMWRSICTDTEPRLNRRGGEGLCTLY